MEERHIPIYEEAAQHQQEQANIWFKSVQELEAQLLIAKSHYKHHSSESERLQNLLRRWKGNKGHEITG
ncbi:hypothetical protein BAMA_18230 [Bacillus manliponensis]|uniref:Uncharacterized protein n=1 Tax=Bacillus manliponensis TaxID=574376 RepID=A0A073JSH3_9BACI|nr:hypothetical protein [Bacillus manliponensis]KEK17151.1 hypothetical protein BAMA_18230 [Bacillus manliponensis]